MDNRRCFSEMKENSPFKGNLTPGSLYMELSSFAFDVRM